jgi:flagellar protein FlaF
MGFSTSGSVAVLFVSMLVMMSTLYPVVETANERMSDASDDRNERSLDRYNTAINVTNVSYNGTAETLTILVNNTGSTTLSVDETDVLLDGAFQTGYTKRVDGDATRTIWAPGEQLELELDGVTGAPGRVKLVTEFGIAATITEV